MEDKAPKLIEDVTGEFHRLYDASGKISGLLEKVKAKTATYAEAQEYALEVSRLIGQAWEKYVTPDTLPDGRMYYNIASRLIPATLDENHALVAGYAAEVQKELNDRAGIGLKAQKAELDGDRVKGLVDLASNAERYDEVSGKLLSSFENFSQHIVDETIRKNADFHHRSGLSPKIIRRSNGKCCAWCRSLAGTHDYPAFDRDVYRRHDNCRCTVLYDPADGSKKFQNVHSRRWTNEKDYAKIETQKPAAERNARAMANGPRRGARTHVSREEELLIRGYADTLGIPQSVLSFNTGSATSFDDDLRIIHIRGDVFPSKFAENPDSILSAKCALAHEYYGHYKQYPSRFAIGDWRDEFEASYRAALDSPNLSDDERIMLMLDAFERAQNAGVPVRYNTIARRMLYGSE